MRESGAGDETMVRLMELVAANACGVPMGMLANMPAFAWGIWETATTREEADRA